MSDVLFSVVLLAAVFGLIGVVIDDNAYRKHQQQIIAQMVANGADPILAACAIYGVREVNKECAVRAGQVPAK